MTLLDSMRRLVGKGPAPAPEAGSAPRARQLDAAGRGGRWANAPTLSNFNAEALRGGALIRHRAAYFARNNEAVVSAVSSLVSNIVGTGIRPQPKHPNDEVRERLNADFEAWAETCDVTGRADFYGMQALAARQMIEQGEALARFRIKNGALRLQAIAPDQLPFEEYREFNNGTAIRAGVEFDPDGAPQAYHVYRARPDASLSMALETVRLPAEDMVHLFVPVDVGQPRGVTWLLPILMTLLEVDQYDDATAVRQKVAAMAAGAVVDTGATEQVGATTQADGLAEAEWSPGSLFQLDPGQDIRWFNPPDTGDYEAFMKTKLRLMGGGLGTTYAQISNDYSDANYSSLRASLIEFRRGIRQIQQTVFVHQFCRPVWWRFIQHEALAGRIDPADLDANPRDYGATWLAPRFEAADPIKDIEAELAEIDAGLKSRTQAARERGLSVEELDEEIAADRARAERLGLTFGNGRPQRQPAEEKQDGNG